MAFIDGSSASNFTGMRWDALGALDAVAVLAIDPDNGNRIPASAVPLTVNVSNAANSGSDVQFQVATDTAFEDVVSAPGANGVGNGPLTAQASGLPSNVPLYWRARGAETGTFAWNAWSPTRYFIVDVNSGKALEHSYENVGVEITPYAGVIEYSTENVGVLHTPYPGAVEHSYENVGADLHSSPDAVEYAYESEVSTNRPKPHIWFLWKPFGFVGEEIWVYGHGLGNPQSEYDARLKMRLGPDYNPADDIEPSIEEWYLQEALPEAYGPDRKIYAGTSVAEPVVNQQVEIVRWLVPGGALPDEPTYHRLFVTHTGGTSNLAPWLMYPTIPVAAAVVERGLNSTSVARLSATLVGGSAIPQRLFAYDEVPYMISGGRAERLPKMSASATTDTELGTWSTESALSDAAAVSMGRGRRWFPDPAHVVPRPDLGTGASLWTPSIDPINPGVMAWRFEAASAPYVDPAYEIETRLGTKIVPAMIFPGDAWAELNIGVQAGPNFTMAITAVLQAPPKGRGHILTTKTFSTPDVGSTSASLQLEGSALNLFAGGKLYSNSLQRLSKRPVVIIMSVKPTSVYLSVLDLSPSGRMMGHPPFSAANTGLWLGRNDQLGAQLYPAAMDVLEITYWAEPLLPQEVRARMNQLDGIYGVTG